MRGYLKHYLWFWKESFSYMQGHSKLSIALGCLKMGHSFAVNMVRWDKLTSEQKEYLYLTSDRTIDFDTGKERW